jgi:hypothetical protein
MSEVSKDENGEGTSSKMNSLIDTLRRVVDDAQVSRS